MTLVNGQAATDGEGAKRFLGGIGEERFEKLVKTGVIRKLGRDWYLYEDLIQGLETLRQKRDVGATIELHVVQDSTHRRRTRKSQVEGGKVEYRTPLD